jgi:hypothetical protein
MTRWTMIAISMACLAAVPATDAAAQERGRERERIPPGHMPPAGMCRIWIDGVPPGQQPEPTDCASAVRNRPANARVIYGRRVAGDVRVEEREAQLARAPRLPSMSTVRVFQRSGDRTREFERWLPGPGVTVRILEDAPEKRIRAAAWYDEDGRLLQIWRDTNLDDRVDAIEVYNGQPRALRVIR